MPADEIDRDRLNRVLEVQLKRRCSKALFGRLRNYIVQCDGRPESVAEMLHRVRSMVRLFVDEGLADEVHARLCQELGSKAPPDDL